MVINKQSYILSEWNEAYEYYINTWYGEVSEDEFKSACLISRDFMVSNNVKYHLADTTQMKSAWTVGDWLYENIWKPTIASGLTHFGAIIPDRNLMSYASEVVMKKEIKNRGIVVENYRTFETLKEAEQWILEAKKSV